MASPILVAYQESPWRDHVNVTWKYLQQHYQVTGDEHCATHIHVSVEGGYSLEELKRIACSVIHFEPAFDALVPPPRRSGNCEFSKSNWLDSDHLALQNRSRAQSIVYIDMITDFYSLLVLMNPDNEKKFGWNFLSIEKYYTVEFRKPQASITVEAVLSWAELAISFVQAAIRHGSPQQLQDIPSTVGGLRWFLEQINVPGLNEHHRLHRFWRGIKMDEFFIGMPMRLFLTDEEKRSIAIMRELDEKEILRSIKTAKEPYWQ